MNVRHARWGLGAALGVVALVAALRSLAVYQQHALWLGVAAVAALAIIQVFGFLTLGFARQRLVREEARLGSAGSTLWAARRKTSTFGRFDRLNPSHSTTSASLM